MTITLELPPETEASLLAQAKARGLSLDAFVKTIIASQAAAAESVRPLANLKGGDLDSAFEEMADLVPPGTPLLSDEALSRESIYSREDEWNKNSR